MDKPHHQNGSKGSNFDRQRGALSVFTGVDTNTFFGERYRRIACRRGKKKALVVIGRSILVIVWHLLADPNTEFIDLGSDHHDRSRGTQRAICKHLNALHALGYNVTVSPAA